MVDRLLERTAPFPSAWDHLAVSTYHLNRGRPWLAAAHLDSADRRGFDPPWVPAAVHVSNALFADGDTAAAHQAAARLDRQFATGPADPLALCLVAFWRSREPGRAVQVASYLSRLERAGGDPSDNDAAFCALALTARVAALQDRADAGRRLEQLDSLAATGPSVFGPILSLANLTIADLRERRGEHEAALSAVRRRQFMGDNADFLSTQLREEGRLAALTGDREGAIRAYRHYLLLRSDPEPSLSVDVERVRADLARLMADSGSR
jgi:hypothetical protein